MKKTLKYTTRLSLQIILLGITGFFGTFLSDYIESIGWFGDYERLNGSIAWGARHTWYVWLLSILVCIQIIRIIMWSVAFWDEEARDKL